MKKDKQIEKDVEHFTIRFNEQETLELRQLMTKYRFQKKSSFIKKCIFQKEFHIVTYDESLYDIVDSLDKILYNYRKVGANYNQAIVHLKRAFGEKQATSMLVRLATNTTELVQLTETIAPILELLKQKYLNDCENQHKHKSSRSLVV